MFTGLIHDLGTIAEAKAQQEGLRVNIVSESPFFTTVKIGESIAVDGVCLTVSACGNENFITMVSPETLARTKGFKEGWTVNLERALQIGDRLGGHFVSGHIDDVGQIEGMSPMGDFIELIIKVPQNLSVFLAEKGSVAVNGISLTINGFDHQRLKLMLIPETWHKTNLQFLEKGDVVNLEVDLIARYVVHCLRNGEEPWKH